MTATFIPCGAKLPVIAMMGGVMTSYATGSYEAGGLMAPCMYFIGIEAVLVAAIILKKTKPFSGIPHPEEISNGMKDLPDNPKWRNTRSITNAIRTIYPQSSKIDRNKNKIAI